MAQRRLNVLTGEWVLVSPHRDKRPWQGQTEIRNTSEELMYDPGDISPGNTRKNGIKNPNYTDTYVFENDFPAILPTSPTITESDFLFRSEHVTGKCFVMCFSPFHNMTIPQLPLQSLELVVEKWKREYEELIQEENINYVQIFENKGSLMGCSNPHPHCQIWALSYVPNEVKKEMQQFQSYEHGKCLLCDYIKQEQEKRERIVYENEAFIVLTPFWATWPYETLLVPKVHIRSIRELDSSQIKDFSDALKVLTVKYDNLFNESFPYSMGIHQTENEIFHMHVHFYPPLLRSGVKKFLVGFEMLGEPQRDFVPEKAAKLLMDMETENIS